MPLWTSLEIDIQIFQHVESWTVFKYAIRTSWYCMCVNAMMQSI